jgi:phenylalanyl-tRNA synthetase beta chain
MRVPLPWLREYCDPPLDTRGVEERLTMTGTKVEAILRHGVGSVENFIVGRVLEARAHPDADRLKVCTVDLGADGNGGEPVSIVCGAPNVAGGQTVAVARPGAVMPDGTKLRRAKLRGVVSDGMILSESELEIGSGGEGILVLDDLTPDAEFAPGTPLAQVLPIAMDVLELEITPNRPDCLGVYGVARELHAATGTALSRPPWDEDAGADAGSAEELAGASVRVECPELCPRFTARVFEDVTIAPSPAWLKARLSAAGQRTISNVVDITNYAMLLSGQPLHAFDLERIAGGRLVVRRARAGEQITTLDGQTRALDSEMVLIEDAEGPTSIAGVMGGERSEVTPQTTRVLMEAANWVGPNIHRTSWTLGLRSEASGRFEKGLAPEQCMHAQALATQLMLELCGARLVPGTIDIGTPPPAPASIRLREQRVRAILGVAVARERQAEILRALEFEVRDAPDGLDVQVPPLRRDDVTREIDVIEEVARIDGLERLPATLPARRGAAGRLSHRQRLRRAAEDALVGRGLHEIVGWSFADPLLLDRLRLPEGHPMRRVVVLENPISEEQSIMRPTLLGSLLDAARYNAYRNGPDLALFESGTVYRAREQGAGGESPAEEHHAIGALLSGALLARSWRSQPVQADFFAAKALLEGLLERFHVDWSVEPSAQWPFLHPGRSAAVLARPASASGEAAREPLALGLLGELHPLVTRAWDLERTAVFVIDAGKLAQAAPEVPAFRSFGAFPALRQDIAVTLPDGVALEQVLARVRSAAGSALEDAHVFDVYTGEQVGEGRRSLALALSFRDAERTLTDEDVAPLRERILAALAELGGELRGQ